MTAKWLEILIGVGVTLLIGLVAVIWAMLKERIELQRQETDRRFRELGTQYQGEFQRIDREIEGLRKAKHSGIERISAVETFLKYFVVHRRPGSGANSREDDDSPQL